MARQDAERNAIAIYRDHLLGFSETFVVEQAENVPGYRPVYVGSRRIKGLALPRQRTVTVNDGTHGLGHLQEATFKWHGTSRKLARYLRHMRVRLIHAHFADDGAIVLPLATSLGLPLIVSLHGYDVTMSEEALAEGTAIRRRYLARRTPLKEQADVFLAVSDYIRARALERGFPPERTHVHYTGVDTGYFAPDPDATREQRVLFVGRLVEKKGCIHLLRAMRRVADRQLGAEIAICGDGPLRAAMESESRDLPCRVVFHGVRDRAEVRRLMQTSRVLCVPSTLAASGDAEGFGMIFAEAQACGLPVASFATGGVPEAVADGETGLLVPDRDIGALAEALDRLLSDERLWRRLSDNGRAYVLKHFDLTRQCRRLAAIYDEVTESRAPDARKPTHHPSRGPDRPLAFGERA